MNTRRLLLVVGALLLVAASCVPAVSAAKTHCSAVRPQWCVLLC